MLIRSQDRKQLHPLNSIVILPRHKGELNSKNFIEGYQVVIFIGSDGDAILGKYSTEEKAIKVLDMIENFYSNFKFCEIWGSDMTSFYDAIFQMPQDDEVKV